ncbi:hypothetical protein VTO42DRAFT_6622 [Malbranchea cinnamomea]
MSLKNELEQLRNSSVEQQASYIYRPAKRGSPQAQKQNKRRKCNGATQTESEILPFVPLLGGQEAEVAVKLRYRAFKEFWSVQENKIQTILRNIHSDVLESIITFINYTSGGQCNGRIPTGVITLGSSISSTGRLFYQLQKQVEAAGDVRVAILGSGDVTNLKTTLKFLIRAVISSQEGDESPHDFTANRVGPKYLPYDLDLLYEYVQQKGVKKVVIAFKDTEAFDQHLLSDLISLIWSWLDRIQFILLFGVVTSVELFESRIPRSTVNLLQGQCFEVRDSDCFFDRVYIKLQRHDEGVLWLGHSVSRLISQLSKNHFQSPDRLSACIKYGYMAHFFANPLSVFLAENVPARVFHDRHLCEAIRNLPSFRGYVDTLLNEGDTSSVRKLLDDDKFLVKEARKHVSSGQRAMKRIFQSVEWIETALRFLKSAKTISSADLAIQALQGELLNSRILEDLLASIRKLPSDSFKDILGIVPDTITEISTLSRDFDKLLKSTRGSGPLRSQYDEYYTTHKTTVVGQRVKLTKGKATLSKEDSEYTDLVDRLHKAIVEDLSTTLIKPESLFMHEAFLNDHKVPMKDAFTPRPRFAVERGLSTPSDYLGTKSDEAGQFPTTDPAISILYQLYMESGAFVNIYDLWRAFYTIIGGEDEGCEERLALALFYRALSELKMMGMIKSTRRKPDHLAKTVWTGL